MMSFEEALAGKEIPEDIRKSLTLVSIPYFSFERKVGEGQLVVHKDVAGDVEKIFKKLCEMQFPIQQIVPAVAYGWDDDASMSANNTSAFNYRIIYGTDRLSNHSYGRAIDINPVQNPYHWRSEIIMPSGAHYDLTKPGTITKEIASLFTSYGWNWGGKWKHKDYQHFEKPD